MNVPQSIVDILLENELVRACAACEKETGQRTPGASHGYCKRHLIDMHKQNLLAAIQSANQPSIRTAQERIREIRQRPDSDFPPDLSQRQQVAA